MKENKYQIKSLKKLNRNKKQLKNKWNKKN